MMKKIVAVLSLALVIFTSETVGVYAQGSYNRSVLVGKSEVISADLNRTVFESTKEAILINKKSVVDSISVTPLAYAKDVPIILGDWMELPRSTKNYIKDSGIEKITIVGGLASISRTLENDIKDMGIEVSRISGVDRVDTSIKIANQMNKINEFSEMFVMSSSVGIENGLSIYSYAAKKNIPIVWAVDDKIEKTIKYIEKQNVDKVYAIGNSKVFTAKLGASLENVEFVNEIKKSDTNLNYIKELYGKNDIDKVYTAKVNLGNQFYANEYISLGLVSAKQDIPIMIASENLTHDQEKFLEEYNVKELAQIGSKIGEYSLFQTIFNRYIISAAIMVLIILVITVRAFKVKS